MQSTTSSRHYVIQSRKNSEAARVQHMLENMAQNKAYRYAAEDCSADEKIELLQKFRDRYSWYRQGWREIPRQAIDQKRDFDSFRELQVPPLSVDIETAAICDLACPFCYRQHIVTPDKIMDEKLYYRVIDQCAELGVPSVKLNWRGEPLLHPKLPQLIDYAKQAGILEVIVNTNAVRLDEKKARAIIDAGLDLLIYSFDGGTKKTYDQMRVGRYRENTFEEVYANIVRFAELRKSMAAFLPRTKIQMVLTADTFEEQEQFFELFSDCVDDVSVKAYTERGGELSDLPEDTRERFSKYLNENNLPEDTDYWRDLHGQLFVSKGRLPCEQPFQRLMVTYSGRVCMCCYDWGVEHPVGYVDERAFLNGDSDYNEVYDKAQNGAKGFELLQQVVMPKRYNHPEKQVQTLSEIWHNNQINTVRRAQIEGTAGNIPVCSKCPFKETYQWQELPES